MINSYLNIKTSYSLLDSLLRIDEAVEFACQQGFSCLGICDLDLLSALPYFVASCKKKQIKPLLGLEVKVRYNDELFRLACYAKNNEGYKQLNQLSSSVNQENLVIDLTQIKMKFPDLLFVVVFDDSLFYKYVLEDNSDAFTHLLKEFRDYIPTYFFGLTKGKLAFNQIQYQKLENWLENQDIRCLAFDAAHYYKKEDYKAYHILKCIANKTTIEDKNLLTQDYLYLKTKDELVTFYSKKSLSNTELFASMCNCDYLVSKTTLPSFSALNQKNSASYLISLCKLGLRLRLNNQVFPEYENRLKDELNTIIKMHFEDYFLIVYDFIQYAKKHDILVGPGRGSAAGSLVSYVLGITDIDPIQYQLLFERFLNPERISMPDIDIDFQDNRRQEVIDYVVSKYGQDKVAHIITFGSLKARQVIRDVSKVYQLSAMEIDRLSKAIPNVVNMTLMKAYQEIKVFRELILAKQVNQEIFDICLKLEGLPRHFSIHAAGIVLSSCSLTDVVALKQLETNIQVTQYQMDVLEEIGLIKMDFLGLKNLSTIQEIVTEIKLTIPDFKLNQISLQDEKTFELIQQAKCLGVFQLESSGMMALLRKMKPKNFREIAITIALFRPGPMQNIDLYLENRSRPTKIVYLHPDLEDILKETSGIIVYQEQIMQIAQKLAGFTLAKADSLRKAMSKKKRQELELLEQDFIQGCQSKQYSKELAEEVYRLILRFADYGFNKSHSIAYAMIAYQMAYLKTNYPIQFYKSLLNSVISIEDKTYDYILECKEVGVKLLAPNIQYSTDSYLSNKHSLLLPLTMIKGIGHATVQTILQLRKQAPFQDYIDTVCRFIRASVSIKSIIALIDSGAFDIFPYNRKTMLENLDMVSKYANIAYFDSVSILQDSDRPVIIKYHEDEKEKAEKEKEILGFYFSVNPIVDMKKHHRIQTTTFSHLKKITGSVSGFGVIDKIKTHRTKRGDWMAFVMVSDDTSSLDLAIMPNLFNKYNKDLSVGTYIYFDGKIEKEGSVLVNRLEVFHE